MANGIIEHRDDYRHFFAVREVYLAVCRECTYKKPGQAKSRANIHCKAVILDILENWTNHKLKHGLSIAIFMTYKQWEDAMYGLYGRNAIIDSLDELIGEGLITRSPYKMYGKDTFQYELNYKLLNKRIKQLPQNSSDAFQMKRDEDTPEAKHHVENDDTRFKRDASSFQMGRNIDTPLDSHIDSKRKEKRTREAKPAQSKTTPPSQSSSYQKRKEEITRWYTFFEGLYRKLRNDPTFKLAHTDKDNAAITSIIEAGYTEAQVEFVFTDIWNDPKPFWKENRTISATVRQYATRIDKFKPQSMSKPKITTPEELLQHINQNSAYGAFS